MQQVIIKVTDMTCAACSSRVEKALQKVEGVEKANVNLATGKALITYEDQKVTVDALVETIENAGYTPVVEQDQEGQITFGVDGMT